MYSTPKEQREELIQRLMILMIAIIILLSLGTVTYHLLEGWSLIDSLYYSTISLTARGFSELRPSNWVSVLFSVFYLLIGVAVVIYSVSSLIAYYITFYQKQLEVRVRNLVDKIGKKEKKRWVVLNPKH